MRDNDFGELESVSSADLAQLENERLAFTAAHARANRWGERVAVAPIPEGEPPVLELPDRSQHYVGPSVAVDFDSRPLTIQVGASKIDTAAAATAGRDRVQQRFAQTRADFAASPTWENVRTLRQRHAAARQRLADASLAVQKATDEHATAAANESANAGKLWKQVVAGRDNLASAEATLAAVARQLQEAEAGALEELGARMSAAIAEERRAIAENRERLRAELLEAMRQPLERLKSEDQAATEIRRLSGLPAKLPAD